MVKRLPKPPIRPRKDVDFDRVVERLEQHDRAFDQDLLDRVHEFSAEKHRDQRRKSGEPYLTHPVYVSYILADLKFDATCVAVGLLHDVLEDTSLPRRSCWINSGATSPIWWTASPKSPRPSTCVVTRPRPRRSAR